MQVEYRQGDLIDCVESIIVHGCNARRAFNAGVARAIRQRFPFAYEAYLMAFDRGLRLGEVIWAIRIVDGERPRIVGNAITQADFGNQPRQYVDYDAVRAAMRAVDNFILHAANGIAVLPKPIAVAMPRIGAGLGGGDWSVIVQIIEDESQHFTPVVYQL
jgi:O-acetyl-ADP-ribose deacetylase (regulator of RNase III)